MAKRAAAAPQGVEIAHVRDDPNFVPFVPDIEIFRPAVVEVAVEAPAPVKEN